MVNRSPFRILIAAAMACCIVTVGSGYAVRAATVVTSTTVAAAPATGLKSLSAAPRRPRWMGVSVEKIPPIFSRLLGLAPQQGLLVIQVIPNSPAFKAHLEPGDLLITLDGKALENPFALIREENRIGAIAPKLIITLIRDGMRKTVAVTPMNRPQHLIFFFTPRSEPAGVLPAGAGPPHDIQPTSLMTVGPGVKLHIPALAVPSRADDRPDLFTVRQWIGQHGTRRLEIFWRSRAYEIQPGSLNKLPPPVQAVARLILHGHTRFIAPVPSRRMLIQQRITEIKALIQRLHIREKALEEQSAAAK